MDQVIAMVSGIATIKISSGEGIGSIIEYLEMGTEERVRDETKQCTHSSHSLISCKYLTVKWQSSTASKGC